MSKYKKIIVIGSGPIIIGQACEFDYSGTQALKALKEEGIKVILINSNPATIMTDPDFSYRTYIEPITFEIVEQIIKKEKPDAILPTMGGQTALNIAVELKESGILDKYGVEMIGAKYESIKKAEDRILFKKSMEKIGLKVPPSFYVSSVDEALKNYKKIGFPLVIRPSFTLGGTGGRIVNNLKELKDAIENAIKISPVGKALVEKSLTGWKEFELEVVRDRNDNVIIVCSIENIDPMGIHTGDSITVAPQQTLRDKEYQDLRDASIEIMREIGVDTGGSNIQFAVSPDHKEFYVIEMNPRVSRSSALASKATGFPIARIAAKLAIGYTLDRLKNEITKITPSSFEPALDYVAVKIPKFAFEKFKGVDPFLSTQMKSVGEVLAIGRNFKEALLKGIISLEDRWTGLNSLVERWLSEGKLKYSEVKNYLEENLKSFSPYRIWLIADALRWGFSVEKIYELTKIDPFFIDQIKQIIEQEDEIVRKTIGRLKKEDIQKTKEFGFSDKRISELLELSEESIREIRKELGIKPCFYMVDTCAGEIPAKTPYFYSTYEKGKTEEKPFGKKGIVILGAGPSRIGQGIEFDYICVQGIFSIKEENKKGILINSNPETVSTDFDISDRLYFEPVEKERVLEILDFEKPYGVILQFGGQTPLNMARDIEKEGFNILGTSSYQIERAEDRKLFNDLIEKLGLKKPRGRIVYDEKEAIETVKEMGFPVLIRPSYVLGGRAMYIGYDMEDVKGFLKEVFEVSKGTSVLIDEFLIDAKEFDVDAISDGKDFYLCGIIEHIQEAGIHSGDSSMIFPPLYTPEKILKEIEEIAKLIAKELEIKGFMNLQIALRDEDIYILEVNPRASRTIPFLSKAQGIPFAKIATKIIVGKKLKNYLKHRKRIEYYAVKEPVFSFSKLPGSDPVLGPEMRSTGEAMGIDKNAYSAFLKAYFGAGWKMNKGKKVFISVRDAHKPLILNTAQIIKKMGYSILATEGTARYLRKHGIKCKEVKKISEGFSEIINLIKKGEISAIINTPLRKNEVQDAKRIRWNAILYGIPCFTTVSEAKIFFEAMSRNKKIRIFRPLQNLNKK